MPITEQLYHILFEQGSAKDAIQALMGRPVKREDDFLQA